MVLANFILKLTKWNGFFSEDDEEKGCPPLIWHRFQVISVVYFPVCSGNYTIFFPWRLGIRRLFYLPPPCFHLEPQTQFSLGLQYFFSSLSPPPPLFFLTEWHNFFLRLTFKIPRVGENLSSSSMTSLYPLLAAFSNAVVPSWSKGDTGTIVNIHLCWLRTKHQLMNQHVSIQGMLEHSRQWFCVRMPSIVRDCYLLS